MKNSTKIDYMLIYPMRSASTWLATQISKLPNIHYIPKQNFIIQDQNYDPIKFKSSNENKNSIVVGRCNIGYGLNNNYPNLFYRHNSSMKFIAVLRNQIDRFFSHINYMIDKYPYSKWPVSLQKSCKRNSFGRLVLNLDDLVDIEFSNQQFQHRTIRGASLYNASYVELLNFFPKKNIYLKAFKNDYDLADNFKYILNFLKINQSFISHLSLLKKKMSLKNKIKNFRILDPEIISPSNKTLIQLTNLFKNESIQMDKIFNTDTFKIWFEKK